MKTTWEIKKITYFEDFTQIVNIEKDALFEFDFFHHPYSVYFKLILNKKIIGYCGLWVIDNTSQITTIAIRPKYQGLGYGKVLLEFIISYLINKKCDNITLEVRVTNNKA